MLPLSKATYRGPLSWRDNQVELRLACPLFQLPGVTSVLRWPMDWMHCHHLGWLQYLFGSVFGKKSSPPRSNQYVKKNDMIVECCERDVNCQNMYPLRALF